MGSLQEDSLCGRNGQELSGQHDSYTGKIRNNKMMLIVFLSTPAIFVKTLMI